MASPEARLLAGTHDTITIPSPSNAPSSGEIIKLADNRVGVITGINLGSVVTGDPIAVVVRGPIEVPAASAKTISAGGLVYWDINANTALPAADGSLADGDPVIGPALVAKTSGQLVFKVDLGAAAGTVHAS